MGEFELIEQFFKRPAQQRQQARQRAGAGPAKVALGIGDDCALLSVGPGMQLAVSCDMLVEGRHFLSTVDPARLGHKALAVNLSDLAACAARPLGFTLALALPRVEPDWLAGFSGGLLALADACDCPLIGGDTTAGPLNICITVLGEVPTGQALLRSGAQPGDDIYVSGTLGDARLALAVFRGQLALPAESFERVRRRMEQPTPRLALGLALRGLATAAVDISDGLLGDLGHILQASAVGACIDTTFTINSVAVSADLIGAASQLGQNFVRDCVLAGGDDYELVFTAPPARRAAVLAASAQAGTPVTRIGQTEAAPGLRLLDADGRALAQRFASFDHFDPRRPAQS